MSKNAVDARGISTSLRTLHWNGNAHITTTIRPRGLWVTGKSSRSKVHMTYRAFAAWADGVPSAYAVARCGSPLTVGRFDMEPEPDSDLCDECLLADVRPETVYRFFDAAGQLLYVGYTFDPVGRTKYHRQNSRWWSSVASHRFEYFDSETEARAAEAQIIRTEKPLHNVQFRLKEAAA